MMMIVLWACVPSVFPRSGMQSPALFQSMFFIDLLRRTNHWCLHADAQCVTGGPVKCPDRRLAFKSNYLLPTIGIQTTRWKSFFLRGGGEY